MTAKAGRKLDALVAEKVFGLVRCTGCDYYECYALPASPNHGGELRAYSTRIEDAWEVVDRLRERSLLVDLTLGVGVYCRISGLRGLADAREDTAPLAICLAALQAVV